MYNLGRDLGIVSQLTRLFLPAFTGVGRVMGGIGSPLNNLNPLVQKPGLALCLSQNDCNTLHSVERQQYGLK